MERFDAAAWKTHVRIDVRETAGIPREGEVVDVAFVIDDCPVADTSRELRLARVSPRGIEEVTAQFHRLNRAGRRLDGRVAFFATAGANEAVEYRLYCGNPAARPWTEASGLIHRRGDQGPQHRFIENTHYKVETLPKSGQIWHMWDKQGADTSWHINEWPANVERGGDPCHWAPNCWVAYPERITNGYELDDAPGSECDFIDWHYVFGWDDPECEVVEGPVFVEITRRGIVWPHPEHSRPEIRRDRKPRLRAEVTYRFYDRLPFIFQSSVLETLEDLNVFFIRNCQFAFRTHLFSHMIIAPERDGVRPTDEVDVAVFRLMGKANNKPYDWIQHSLSNVLPSKPAWYAYYDEDSHDGFALFPVVERNTNIYSGTPVYQNHATLLTEVHGWSMAAARTFSYTNQRFNAENVTFLPKGERYEEENWLMVYRHDGLEGTLALVTGAEARLKSPLVVTQR